MAENIFSSFDISGQGMSVQRMRLSAVAKNIANVNTTKGLDGQPYRREVVLVRSAEAMKFDGELEDMIAMQRTNGAHTPNAAPGSVVQDNTILVANKSLDNSPPRLVYDPAHPDADEEGYVHYPNINIVTEMVEMISAQRAFEANTGIIEAAKNIARDSLSI